MNLNLLLCDMHEMYCLGTFEIFASTPPRKSINQALDAISLPSQELFNYTLRTPFLRETSDVNVTYKEEKNGIFYSY